METKTRLIKIIQIEYFICIFSCIWTQPNTKESKRRNEIDTSTFSKVLHVKRPRENQLAESSKKTKRKKVRKKEMYNFYFASIITIHNKKKEERKKNMKHTYKKTI